MDRVFALLWNRPRLSKKEQSRFSQCISFLLLSMVLESKAESKPHRLVPQCIHVDFRVVRVVARDIRRGAHPDVAVIIRGGVSGRGSGRRIWRRIRRHRVRCGCMQAGRRRRSWRLSSVNIRAEAAAVAGAAAAAAAAGGSGFGAWRSGRGTVLLRASLRSMMIIPSLLHVV